eukprot:GCRY01007185.1.p1 GENE.GCRY01007185.1~~GCRY01007185.1.p1  ORF type:complete len:189 (+),score=25.18 GCRY01007185.1:340-906(+)
MQALSELQHENLTHNSPLIMPHKRHASGFPEVFHRSVVDIKQLAQTNKKKQMQNEQHGGDKSSEEAVDPLGSPRSTLPPSCNQLFDSLTDAEKQEAQAELLQKLNPETIAFLKNRAQNKNPSTQPSVSESKVVCDTIIDEIDGRFPNIPTVEYEKLSWAHPLSADQDEQSEKAPEKKKDTYGLSLPSI